MQTKQPVRLVKKEKPKDPELQAEAESADPGRWSTAVRGWVGEVQQNRHVEPLRAFDSLFKDEQS